MDNNTIICSCDLCKCTINKQNDGSEKLKMSLKTKQEDIDTSTCCWNLKKLYPMSLYGGQIITQRRKQMNEQITVNFENLNETEREQLMALIEKSNTTKPEPWWKDSEFDVANGGCAYYINRRGVVESGRLYPIYYKDDENIIKFGNACKDKAYMEQRAKEIKLNNLMHNFAYKVNEGWVADWDDRSKSKYYCLYDNELEMWYVSMCTNVMQPTGVYFKSTGLAQRCIDEIILPFERGEI